MGTTRQGLYKRMMIYRDLERLLAESAPYIQANGADTGLIQLTPHTSSGAGEKFLRSWLAASTLCAGLFPAYDRF